MLEIRARYVVTFQTMKVIFASLLALLAVSCADILKRQTRNTNCNDMAALNYINNVNPEICDSINTTAEQTCGDDCLGQGCTFYTNNGYTTLCLSTIAIGCYTGLSGSGTVAASCQRCFDSQVLTHYLTLPSSCNTQSGDFNTGDLCSDECAGTICTYYRDNGYPADCRTDLAQLCGSAAPTVCQSDSGPTQATGGSDSEPTGGSDSGPTQATGGSDSEPTQATGGSDSGRTQSTGGSGPTQATGGSDSGPSQATGGSDSGPTQQATGGSPSATVAVKEVAVLILLVVVFLIF